MSTSGSPTSPASNGGFTEVSTTAQLVSHVLLTKWAANANEADLVEPGSYATGEVRRHLSHLGAPETWNQRFRHFAFSALFRSAGCNSSPVDGPAAPTSATSPSPVSKKFISSCWGSPSGGTTSSSTSAVASPFGAPSVSGGSPPQGVFSPTSASSQGGTQNCKILSPHFFTPCERGVRESNVFSPRNSNSNLNRNLFSPPPPPAAIIVTHSTRNSPPPPVLCRWETYGRVYHSSKLPGITVAAYVERILRYFCCSPECVPIALALIDRFVEATEVAVETRNAYRLFLTAMVVAVKSREDLYHTTTYYAHVGGITPAELRSLEIHFCSAISWSIFVPVHVYNVIAVGVGLSAVVPASPPPPSTPLPEGERSSVSIDIPMIVIAEGKDEEAPREIDPPVAPEAFRVEDDDGLQQQKEDLLRGSQPEVLGSPPNLHLLCPFGDSSVSPSTVGLTPSPADRVVSPPPASIVTATGGVELPKRFSTAPTSHQPPSSSEGQIDHQEAALHFLAQPQVPNNTVTASTGSASGFGKIPSRVSSNLSLCDFSTSPVHSGSNTPAASALCSGVTSAGASYSIILNPHQSTASSTAPPRRAQGFALPSQPQQLMPGMETNNNNVGVSNQQLAPASLHSLHRLAPFEFGAGVGAGQTVPGYLSRTASSRTEGDRSTVMGCSPFASVTSADDLSDAGFAHHYSMGALSSRSGQGASARNHHLSSSPPPQLHLHQNPQPAEK